MESTGAERKAACKRRRSHIGKTVWQSRGVMRTELKSVSYTHLDAKEELKNALKEYKGTVLMVCHEPEFYDGLATSVWDCSEWTTKVI